MHRIPLSAHAENVLRIRGIPEGGRVPDVGLAGEQEFEGDVAGAGGVGEEFVGLVVRG